VKINTGDYLLSVDGVEMTARTNLDELLDHKIGRRVALTIAQSVDGGGRREAIAACNPGHQKGLVYRQWVDGRRAYVPKASGGRLGVQ
jgi:hypothetical protein